MKHRQAIYAGSFDPLTNGHLDILQRALTMFDEVILAFAHNEEKKPFFSIEERMHLAQQCTAHLQGVRIQTFSGLLVEYAKNLHIPTIVRGLRAVSDFEYEFQLASMNRKLQPSIDTVFMMTSEEHFYVSSRLIREIASLGGDVTPFVPLVIKDALIQRAQENRALQNQK